MSGAEYPDGGPGDGRSPRQTGLRRIEPRRIGWRAAGRVLNGQDGGRGTEDLRTLIAIASAPAPTPTGHAGAERTQSVLPNAVLAAFHETAAAPQTTASRPVRRHSASRTRTLVLRFAASVLVVCGAGVAAASAGVLPAGMQRIAHDYLGVGGAPSPSTGGSSANAATSGVPTGGAAATPPTTGTVPTSTMAALCRQVPQTTGSDWRANLSAADQTTLITAAGADHKVKSYCARLLESLEGGAKATASPEPSPSSAIPSVKPTPTHGNPHASRSPTPRSTAPAPVADH